MLVSQRGSLEGQDRAATHVLHACCSQVGLQSVNARQVVPGASLAAPRQGLPLHALAQRRGTQPYGGVAHKLPPAAFAAVSQENPTEMFPGLALMQ